MEDDQKNAIRTPLNVSTGLIVLNPPRTGLTENKNIVNPVNKAVGGIHDRGISDMDRDHFNLGVAHVFGVAFARRLKRC